MTSNDTDQTSTASYKAAGFSNRIGWGANPALLLVDVCKAYFTPGSPLDCSSYPPAAAAPQHMKTLVSSARKGGVPIIWTTCRYENPDMSDAGIFYQKAKVIDIWHVNDTRGLGDWMEGLEPHEKEGDVVIKKTHPSAFFATTLATQLTGMRVDTLVVCGVSTSGCVRATAMDAMCLNFRPMIVGEACGDRGERVHEGNLFDMDAKVGDVVGLEEAVEKLEMGWSRM
ncbi:Maleamate amidohydrolase [Lecanosticta acicola]|uniref:Maleamate amidohydrolase n=1 Tax=Lecanosticta acicola TaxID=111012 RepID=A0AAI9EAF6_9PEZI|nr:Maleamate amidohydrolase [Lecanosticta acicola]